ncbi:MAG: PstS family phosphate ABC transporter substrate-binding protein [Rubrobacteraceae bacterium]
MSRIARSRLLTAGLVLALGLALAACGGSGGGGGGGGGSEELSGSINIEGSSTVIPITEAVADGFGEEVSRRVRISIGGAGTSDGFEAFCNGNTQISDASRPIDQEDEVPLCEENGVEFIEIPVAIDGLSVVVNSENDFAEDVTLDELTTMWSPEAEGEVEQWSDVRDSWPDEPLSLYGAGTQSGTFDFFTEFVNGEEGVSRSDYQASEDDNVLVQGIQGDQNALGYFGYSYYAENEDTLKALAVDDVEPNPETIASGEYPLSRPLFIYVNTEDLEQNRAVREFVEFYIQEGNLSDFVEQADYINYPDSTQQAMRQHYEAGATGTLYNEQGELPGGDIESALEQSQ